MLMSMFYENNLMNSFLYRRNIQEVSSPLCYCGTEEQTVHHIVLRCEQVDPDLRTRAMNCLQTVGGVDESTIVMLNFSRDKEFMNILVEIIESQRDVMRSTIELN